MYNLGRHTITLAQYDELTTADYERLLIWEYGVVGGTRSVDSRKPMRTPGRTTHVQDDGEPSQLDLGQPVEERAPKDAPPLAVEAA